MGIERSRVTAVAAADAVGALQALRASGVAWVVACAAGAALKLPPAALADGPPHALWPVLLAAGLLAHWAGVGVAARRLQRSVLGWLGLAVCLTPIGGAAALSLLGLMAAAEPADAAGAPMGRAPAVSGA